MSGDMVNGVRLVIYLTLLKPRSPRMCTSHTYFHYRKSLLSFPSFQCTVKCGGGVQRRYIACILLDEHLSFSKDCNDSSRYPTTSRFLLSRLFNEHELHLCRNYILTEIHFHVTYSRFHSILNTRLDYGSNPSWLEPQFLIHCWMFIH